MTIDALTMVAFLALLGTFIQAAFAAGDAYRRHQMATDSLNARAQLLREAPRRRPIRRFRHRRQVKALARGAKTPDRRRHLRRLDREATSWACITLASGVAFLNALMRG